MVKIDDPDLNMNNALVGKFSYEDLSIHFVKHETPYITKYYVYNKTNGHTNDYDESKYLILISFNETDKNGWEGC